MQSVVVPRMRASGVQPICAAFSAVVRITADAPSFSLDELAAVTVPALAPPITVNINTHTEREKNNHPPRMSTTCATGSRMGVANGDERTNVS
jgi:hypothetical protein